VEASREGGFFNVRVLICLVVVLAGVFLALLSFGPATSGFAQGTTREEMAVALAQALNVQIPACVPGQEMFHDVPASSPFCPFIEELARRGITGGCGGGNYCPSATVNREQMAVFIVKAIAGVGVVITDPRNTAVGDSALFNNTTGADNTATGYQALFSNTTIGGNSGSFNTATGVQALFKNTIGSQNTATGRFALFSNTIGSENTATGVRALQNNTDGVDNTATGFQALMSNTSVDNTANGAAALQSNTTGSDNTAVGSQALLSNKEGSGNTATGVSALFANDIGNFNTATGDEALNANTTGVDNTAVGAGALFANNGDANTAIGFQALLNNTLTTENTAIGFRALANNTGAFNTAIGANALDSHTMGNSNIALGFNAGSSVGTGSNNIDIGNDGVFPDSATIRIGGGQTATFIAGISGVNEGGTISAVYINTNGQLGTQPPPSSRRFKKEIMPMDQASEAILALKPVTFHYRSDTKGTPQFGLIAEEVAEINPDLVVRDENGEIYTVRYDAVNAMLLNEFLKEHKTVEQLRATIDKQEATIARQQADMKTIVARLNEQAAQIQKVSAQIEVSKPVTTVAEAGQ
jgi:trimeric autotransporter adhesin